MDAWWIVVVLFVLAVLGVMYVVMQRSRRGVRSDAAPPAADRDFEEERESSRLQGMSAEDQAWQAASLEKERARRDGSPPPP